MADGRREAVNTMVLCPRCSRFFREPPDEIGEHDCPNCNYSRDELGGLEDRDEAYERAARSAVANDFELTGGKDWR